MKGMISLLKCSALAVALVVACSGCAHIPKTSIPTTKISQPPPGKALVNFHRPSGMGRLQAYPIFDANGKMLVDLPGCAMFQAVCDPGDNIFIGITSDRVSVLNAKVAPDRIYDVLVDIGMGTWTQSMFFSPMDKNNKRKTKIPSFERREKLVLVINPNSPRVSEYEAAKQRQIMEIKTDFLGGAKSDRVKYLNPDDCR